MCDGESLVRALTLTPTPPGNAVLKHEELGRPETKYPLELHFCEDCHHVQLGHVVDPKILYQNDYTYVSGTSDHFVRHLRTYARDMVRRFALPGGALVADIGSNDGTCLRGFQDLGMKVLGVDPANRIAEAANRAGIPTINDFFSQQLAEKLRDEHGPADFITSHNALAHIDHLEDVVRGVHDWLADDGVFVLEVGYFVDVFSRLQFDTIYHEHLDYHTVAPFRQLFERTGMELVAVERIEPQGGSIRVMAQKKGGRATADGSVPELIAMERELGLHRAATLAGFGERIRSLGDRLGTLLRDLKGQGKSIAGFGAPTKATTLTSEFGITAEHLEFIVDDNPLKHGKYLPVSHIPIVPTEELYRRKPDYTLILAWNFATPIMAAHQRYVDQGGRFVVPMPEPRIA